MINIDIDIDNNTIVDIGTKIEIDVIDTYIDIFLENFIDIDVDTGINIDIAIIDIIIIIIIMITFTIFS